jgi:hypothetical protein
MRSHSEPRPGVSRTSSLQYANGVPEICQKPRLGSHGRRGDQPCPAAGRRKGPGVTSGESARSRPTRPGPSRRAPRGRSRRWRVGSLGPGGRVRTRAQVLGVGAGRELSPDGRDDLRGERDFSDAGVALGSRLEPAAEAAGVVADVNHLDHRRGAVEADAAATQPRELTEPQASAKQGQDVIPPEQGEASEQPAGFLGSEPRLDRQLGRGGSARIDQRAVAARPGSSGSAGGWRSRIGGMARSATMPSRFAGFRPTLDERIA